MTNVQLYLAIGLPIVTVLSSMTVLVHLISDIREDIRAIRANLYSLKWKLDDKMEQK